MRRAYWPLWILILAFITPLLGALLILLQVVTLNSKSVQHGTLIQPAQKLNFSALIPKKWHVIYISPEDCTTVCQAQKKTLVNLHTALGPDQARVIMTSTTAETLNLAQKDGSMLIIDPLGNYIMHYAPEANLSGLLKDLKRLLKYSHAK